MTRLASIKAMRLTVRDLDRLADFYAALGFSVESRAAIGAGEMALMGLSGEGERLSLRLGATCLDLDRFAQMGRPCPGDVTGVDTCFQHFAIVTANAATSWTRALAAGATPISVDGPVTLPASSGGVTAFKFRDPEGHPLEFLQFPVAGNALGIDHSAISVADVGASRHFYKERGMTVGEASFNHGPTQAALDGLMGAEVDVVPLLPLRATPHLELLGYRTPRPEVAARWDANDGVATRIVWQADEDAFLRDLDGHMHFLQR